MEEPKFNRGDKIKEGPIDIPFKIRLRFKCLDTGKIFYYGINMEHQLGFLVREEDAQKVEN